MRKCTILVVAFILVKYSCTNRQLVPLKIMMVVLQHHQFLSILIPSRCKWSIQYSTVDTHNNNIKIFVTNCQRKEKPFRLFSLPHLGYCFTFSSLKWENNKYQQHLDEGLWRVPPNGGRGKGEGGKEGEGTAVFYIWGPNNILILDRGYSYWVMAQHNWTDDTLTE